MYTNLTLNNGKPNTAQSILKSFYRAITSIVWFGYTSAQSKNQLNHALKCVENVIGYNPIPNPRTVNPVTRSETDSTYAGYYQSPLICALCRAISPHPAGIIFVYQQGVSVFYSIHFSRSSHLNIILFYSMFYINVLMSTC